MNPAIYLCMFLPLWLIIIANQRRKRNRAVMIAINAENKGEAQRMNELAKKFVGSECLVYLFDGNSLTGTVAEIGDGAILVRKSNGQEEVVNLSYVTRIREYPTNKNGKKKSVVID